MRISARTCPPPAETTRSSSNATNDGSTNYYGLLVSLRKRYSKGLGFGINYTWSKNLADFVDNLTGGSTPADAYHYSLEKSYSPFDTTHRFVSFATYELPWGVGRPWLNRGIAARIVGGWQLNGIVTLQTGTPFTVTAPDPSQTGGSHASRPNLIADRSPGQLRATALSSAMLRDSGSTGGVALPAVGTFGNVAPRAFHSPGTAELRPEPVQEFRVHGEHAPGLPNRVLQRIQ